MSFTVIEGDVNVHDKDGTGISSTVDGSKDRLDVDAKISHDRTDDLAAKLTLASYYDAAISDALTFIILIDLDDGDAGDYNHVGSSSIKLQAVSATMVKSNIGHQWESIVGVITVIDGTDATVHWFEGAALFAFDTSTVEQHKAFNPGLALDLAVSGGVITGAVGGNIETGITAINTGITLDNAIGNAKTPAVGDLVLKVERISGAGTAQTHYSARYFVD